MALIQCRECKKQISDLATACPSCGAPQIPSAPPVVFAPATVKRGIPFPKKPFICETCGTNAKPKLETKGSFLVELLLYLFFCLPGFIYTAWRMTTRQKVCPNCGGKMIGVATPRGRELVERYY
ncbi:hypothetical protein Cflav_PD5963 [Pedosphaera parvula Ellin514]|uniref:DZANK-type domain-containing protein n=1 Tax=Pedosphaera parvula (strain Ellin514) TaxID=320771 RepID=B9X9Y7_PEDPL|nr:hypothetical protein Cflav_PD5963 [Pedosphaera parvula Ellin514]